MVRNPRRDKGKRQLSERDLWVLPWIAAQYAIRFDQLQVLLSRQPGQRNGMIPGPGGITDSAVDQVIERWEETPALVIYDRIYNKAPGWIWLTPYGERYLGLSYKRHQLSEGTLRHKYYINHVRLDYERRHPTAQWKSERTIRSKLPRRERGTSVPHIPDGEIWQNGVIQASIEIELSPKSGDEIDTDLSEMLGPDSDYLAVWYFVTNADEKSTQAWRVVQEARERLSEDLQKRMQIIDLAMVGKNATATIPETKE